LAIGVVAHVIPSLHLQCGISQQPTIQKTQKVVQKNRDNGRIRTCAPEGI
jgi:hypothetical protein